MAFLSLRREAEESLRRDRWSTLVLIFSFVSLLSQASLILVTWGKLPPQLPLFYSRPWGEAQLSSPATLFIIPAILALTLIVNYSFTIFWVSAEKFLVRVLLSFNLLVALVTLYDVVKIISLLT